MNRVFTFFTFGAFLIVAGAIGLLFEWSQSKLIIAIGLVFELLAALIFIWNKLKSNK